MLTETEGNANRHMRGPRVLYRVDGGTFVEHHIVDLLKKVARVAGLRINGPHILRHTFCSHLAMKGAGQSNSGTRRPQGPDNDAAVHPPQSECDPRRDSVARNASCRRRARRHCGDGDFVN